MTKGYERRWIRSKAPGSPGSKHVPLWGDVKSNVTPRKSWQHPSVKTDYYPTVKRVAPTKHYNHSGLESSRFAMLRRSAEDPGG